MVRFPAGTAGLPELPALPALRETAPQKGDLELFVRDLVTFETGKVTKSAQFISVRGVVVYLQVAGLFATFFTQQNQPQPAPL
ncbi:hypothetical protein YH66_15680 [[Brevibacterium] flavum]|uniref:Uncharacterized protein n=1 Tax=[Brevibacterium] flavum TaxID=92706 RepID=A0A0F6SS04_9CORY|nr:hypothetical protein YH66_15680 [[Brevibacterium] flavum]ANE09717.1 hypothetical protein A3654_15910 [Corynebacterium glutamicum]AST22097.1 hypothetical protein CEY17_15990 [Corynebacterium glutamicum ATCC 14067]KEI21710.1 hypothetical protein KIQ_003660 [Corynebacterium glutamicum ATCC 14067]KIH75022.1 hypothetical protein SD36_00030 [Corynebacterium glutamicum]